MSNWKMNYHSLLGLIVVALVYHANSGAYGITNLIVFVQSVGKIPVDH